MSRTEHLGFEWQADAASPVSAQNEEGVPKLLAELQRRLASDQSITAADMARLSESLERIKSEQKEQRARQVWEYINPTVSKDIPQKKEYKEVLKQPFGYMVLGVLGRDAIVPEDFWSESHSFVITPEGLDRHSFSPITKSFLTPPRFTQNTPNSFVLSASTAFSTQVGEVHYDPTTRSKLSWGTMEISQFAGQGEILLVSPSGDILMRQKLAAEVLPTKLQFFIKQSDAWREGHSFMQPANKHWGLLTDIAQNIQFVPGKGYFSYSNKGIELLHIQPGKPVEVKWPEAVTAFNHAKDTVNFLDVNSFLLQTDFGVLSVFRPSSVMTNYWFPEEHLPSNETGTNPITHVKVLSPTRVMAMTCRSLCIHHKQGDNPQWEREQEIIYSGQDYLSDVHVFSDGKILVQYSDKDGNLTDLSIYDGVEMEKA